MGVTESIARFIVETSFDQIPEKAVQATKGAILTDGLGVTLAGSLDPCGKAITEFVREQRCEGKAGVIGKGFRTSVPGAALANGAMAHAIDYDGVLGFGHIGMLLPSILAPGEVEGASGKELLEAYIIAIEVGARIDSVINGLKSMRASDNPLAAKGWHGTGLLGTLVAAVGCAKVMKLDVEQTRMALGIAASQAAGLKQNFGTMTKPFHAGNAARSGVVAATLAKRGFTADRNILEERFGLFNVYGDKGLDLRPMTEGLGSTFAAANGFDIKRYPCCFSNHACLDTTLDMRQKYSIRPESIKSVECVVNPDILKSLIHHDPKTNLEGKFSLEFNVAIALLDGKAGILQFTDEKVLDPKTKAMIKKITVKVDPKIKERSSATVTISLADGKQYSQQTGKIRGTPENDPLTRDELRAKYRDCARPVLSQQNVERSLQMVENLEDVKKVAELVDTVLSPKKG